MDRSAHDDDDRLLRAALDGSREAFDILYRRHFSHAYSLAYRLCGDRDLAADAAQEAFIGLFTRAQAYRFEEKLAPYLLRSACNHVLQRLRAQRALSARLGRLAAAASPETAEPAVPECDNAAQRALAELPEDQRAVIVLRVHEDMKFREVAEALSCSIDTVKTRYRRGIERLRRALEDRETTDDRR